jgi:AcrR family transcriptional regulator
VNVTRLKLLEAAADTLREQGLAAASARTIAGRAEVNQALVFYHFGTVSDLLEAACRHAVDTSADAYREHFSAVTTLRELLAVGRLLHEREQSSGNVALMAQLMSGGAHDPVLGNASRYAMARWAADIEAVVRRVLAGSPLADLMDPAGVARAISASFIGLQLYEGVDAPGAASALDALDRLGVLVEVVDAFGPVTRQALRAKVKGLRAAPPT